MRRRPPPSPFAPLGLAEPEEAPRRPLVSRRSLAWAGGIVVAGIAWGTAVRFADSLPADMGFIASILKIVVGLAFVIGLISRLFISGFEVDRVALIALLAVGGASIGLNVGPTVVSGATVAGTFTFAPSVPAGAPATEGALECEWASGRWKIGALRTTPIDGLPSTHRLTLDFLRTTMSLANEGARTSWPSGAGRSSRRPAPRRVARVIAAGYWTSSSCRWGLHRPGLTRTRFGPASAGSVPVPHPPD